MEIEVKSSDELIMKLLHYFITEKNYTPVIVRGVKNEIWLENMQEDYKIVRIDSNFILNDEQLKLDLFRTKGVIKSIKKKTFNLSMKMLNIFTDLGENVNIENKEHMDNIYIKEEKDFKNYDFIYKYYPDIDKKLKFSEDGVNLFMKITQDIDKKNKEEAVKVDKIFRKKVVVITYVLMAINILIFLYGLFARNQVYLVYKYAVHAGSIKAGEYYRLLTGTFLHTDAIHLAFNMYALYILGPQVESFFGKAKFLFIYLFSALCGSLLSILLNANALSVGASGAIFGLIGAMIYFGYNFRIYLGNGLLRDMISIVLINLAIGMFISNIDMFAHVGGLVGGLLISVALGITGKKTKSKQINGIILSIIYIAFLIFMNFIYK